MGKKASKSRRVPSLLDEASAASGSSLITASSDGTVKLMPQMTAALPSAPAVTSLHVPTLTKRAKATDTAGAGWGHMTAPEMTQEVKRELLVVKMRGALDPKKFYRSSDHKKGLPKYFQVREPRQLLRSHPLHDAPPEHAVCPTHQLGTVIDGGESGQVTKKQRKLSMLNEMMGDEKIKRRAKSQFLKVSPRPAAPRDALAQYSSEPLMGFVRSRPQVQKATMDGVKKSRPPALKKKYAKKKK